jgi:hypothetical protein
MKFSLSALLAIRLLCLQVLLCTTEPTSAALSYLSLGCDQEPSDSQVWQSSCSHFLHWESLLLGHVPEECFGGITCWKRASEWEVKRTSLIKSFTSASKSFQANLYGTLMQDAPS